MCHVRVHIFNRPISDELIESLGIKTDTCQMLLSDWSLYNCLTYDWMVKDEWKVTSHDLTVLSVEFWIGGKIFRIGSRKIRRVFGDRLGSLMLKWYKILQSGHFLGLKLLYFLSCFLLHNLQLLLLMSIEIDWANI